MNHTTIADTLRKRALSGEPKGFVYTDGERELERVSFVEMDLRAQRIAEVLRKNHPQKTRALLMYPPGMDFIAAFFGCLYAGIVAVPAYPPDPNRLQRTLPRLEAIILDAGVQMVLSTSEIRALASFLPKGQSTLQALPFYATDLSSRDAGADRALAQDLPALSGEGIALVQYTSGSTSDPKGVLVSHKNLLHNLETMWSTRSREGLYDIVGWTPHFHDLGLVLNTLMPVYNNSNGIFLSPLEFLRNPLSWLRTVSRYRGHVSGGPNFGYDLCVRKIPKEIVKTLDLSSWEIAVNSAEPVRKETIDRFAEHFAAAGFRRDAFMPCFGMAETTLVVTIHHVPNGPRCLEVDPHALEQGLVVQAQEGRGIPLVCAGEPHLGTEVVIVDPDKKIVLAEDRVGEIWVKGGSVTSGYLGKEALTTEVFHAYTEPDHRGPFLRTGDLGFLSMGQLFLTGRRKDVVILRGRNHYPQDIEATVEAAHPQIRPGCTIAFCLLDPTKEEQLAVVTEVQTQSSPLKKAQKPSTEELQAIALAIVERISVNHDLLVDQVVLIPKGTLPKTSSGKLQRSSCRSELEQNTLPFLARYCGKDLLQVYLRTRISAITGANLDQVSLDQSLASLGMDSLGIEELAASLERALGVDPKTSAATLRKARSITELLSALSDLEKAPKATPALLSPSASNGVATIQQAIAEDHRKIPGAHVISLGLQISTQRPLADLETLLERAYRQVLKQRPLLCPSSQKDQPGVRVATGIDTDAIAHEARRPFDNDQPLLRLCLYPKEAASNQTTTALVQISASHLAYDAVTLSVILEDLALALLQKPDGGLRLPLDHGVFCAYEQRYLASDAAAADRERLRASLEGVKPESAATALLGSGPPLQRQVSRRVPAAPVMGAAARANQTPYTYLLAAYADALLQHLPTLGGSEVLVGTAVSLRDEAGLGDVFGPVFNYLPLRIRRDSDAKDEILETTKKAVDQALFSKRYPFFHLRSFFPALFGEVALGLPINFNYYDLDRMGLIPSVRSGDMQIAPWPLADLAVVRPYLLNFSVQRKEGMLTLGLRYRPEVLSEAEAARLLATVVDWVAK